MNSSGKAISTQLGAQVMGLSEKVGDVLGARIEARLAREVHEHPLPQHVAFIMDGNRRFAWSKALNTQAGHRKGKQVLENVMDWVLELGIEFMTVYALSTENLTTRNGKELEGLFDLYVEGLNDISEDPRIHENRVKVQVIGRKELLPKKVNEAIDNAEAKTSEYDAFTFTVCLAYGGREEILGAIRKLAEDHAAGELPLDAIDEKAVSKRLWTGDMPDPDLVIRTSGEERISNFLLWQSAYSELYFTDVFWPSFSRRDFLKAVQDYQLRQRRFGE
jgi:tritrans,polycis-undecaprenyl-diphosphate synthase [geranylgeranyl-diphosphate specific]